MNKENVGHTQTYAHNGIVLSHKREWNFAISSNMDGPGCHYAEWNKSNRERHTLYDHLYLESKNKAN